MSVLIIVDQVSSGIFYVADALTRYPSLVGAVVRGVGHAIHKHVRKQNFTTVPQFLGHGLGTFLHGPPDIYHCLNNIMGVMKPGMIFTVEPVVSEGGRRIRKLEDGWTWATLDNSRTAQMEQTILITEHGVERMTE